MADMSSFLLALPQPAVAVGVSRGCTADLTALGQDVGVLTAHGRYAIRLDVASPAKAVVRMADGRTMRISIEYEPSLLETHDSDMEWRILGEASPRASDVHSAAFAGVTPDEPLMDVVTSPAAPVPPSTPSVGPQLTDLVGSPVRVAAGAASAGAAGAAVAVVPSGSHSFPPAADAPYGSSQSPMRAAGRVSFPSPGLRTTHPVPVPTSAAPSHPDPTEFAAFSRGLIHHQQLQQPQRHPGAQRPAPPALNPAEKALLAVTKAFPGDDCMQILALEVMAAAPSRRMHGRDPWTPEECVQAAREAMAERRHNLAHPATLFIAVVDALDHLPRLY